jgi:3-oxoadipate CoA-transferase, alpha subunit
MAIDKRVSSAQAALEGVQDGAIVMMSGFGGAGFANVLIQALSESGVKDLTLVVNSATHPYSLTHKLIENRQVRKIICTAARGRGRDLSVFEQQWRDGLVELECVPQGTFSERIRAAGAGIPAFFTPVGFGTELTKGKEVRMFNGREHVMEEAIYADLALIRADRADRYGNLAFRYAQPNFGPAMATAAKLTIAEIRAFEIHPMAHTEVQLPGVYVDRIVTVGD